MHPELGGPFSSRPKGPSRDAPVSHQGRAPGPDDCSRAGCAARSTDARIVPPPSRRRKPALLGVVDVLRHPTDPTLWLLGPDDVDGSTMLPPAHADAARVLLRWVREFLCRPHPELGRSGPVCPYTRPALARGTLWLTVCAGDRLHPDQIADVVARYREWFEILEPTDLQEAQFKTILVLFPEVSPYDASTLIDRVQALKKSEFVSSRLMLGQFHPGCPEPGLHNSRFRPLQAPVPLLAIRHMVATDWPFLVNDPRHLHNYIAAFGSDIPSKARAGIKAACERHGLHVSLPSRG